MDSSYYSSSSEATPLSPSRKAYERTVKNYIHEVQSLKTENIILKNQINDMYRRNDSNKQMQHQINALQRLGSQLQNISSNELNISNSRNIHASHINELQEKINNLQHTVRELQRNNENLKQKIREKDEHEKNLRYELRRLKQENSDIMEENENIYCRLAQYQEYLPVHKTVAFLENEISRLKQKNLNLKKKNLSLSNSSPPPTARSFSIEYSENSARRELTRIASIIRKSYPELSEASFRISDQVRNLVDEIALLRMAHTD